MEAIYWDHYYNHIILLNLLIVIGLFTSLRLFSGTISHIKASDELLRKDNPAFGISLAGTTLALTIMLSGTIYGSPEIDASYAILFVGVFGILGVGLMALTRLIFDKITLPAISLRDEIVNGNVAVAIADVGNVLAAAIIIRTVLIWVTGYDMDNVLALLGGYLVSQTILTAMTLLNRKAHELLNKESDVQSELQNGNVALSLRLVGKKIGAAFAIATAAHIVVYEQYNILTILFAWSLASLVAIIVWRALCYIAENIIFFRIDLNDEVLSQRNVAIGALQSVIYASMGLLLASL